MDSDSVFTQALAELEAQFLRYGFHRGWMNTSELFERLHVNPSAFTAVLAKLEEQELMSCRRDEHGDIVAVCITLYGMGQTRQG